MDVLNTMELELAIPVIGAVVCSLLVYIFGFQQTHEPSFEHLAVLQSSTKNTKPVNGIRLRTTAPQIKQVAKPKEEVPLVQQKVCPKPDGVVKSVRGAKDEANSTLNVKPTKKVKSRVTENEDLTAGDWIQAPSRKDRKNKTEKSSPSPTSTRSESKDAKVVAKEQLPVSAKKSGGNVLKVDDEVVIAKKEEPKQQQKVIPEAVQPQRVLTIEEALAQFNAPKAAAPSAGIEVSAPKPASRPAPAPVASTKEAPARANKKEPAPAEPKSNVVFDEIGDSWEEAKSRGTRRRARKD